MLENQKVLSIKKAVATELENWEDFKSLVYTLNINLRHIMTLGKQWFSDQDISELKKEGDNFFLALYVGKNEERYFVIFSDELPLKMLKKTKI